jgi:hypothetical protein
MSNIQLRTFISKFKKYKIPIISSILLSIIYISIILYYTHGALLYGSDQYGYYSIAQSLSKIDPQNLVYAFSLLLSLNNFYVGSYIAFFIFTFIALVSVYYLTVIIFRGYIDESYLPYLAILASFLYLFNPITIVNTSKSILSNVSIYQSAYIIFLYEIIKLFKTENLNNYNVLDIFVMGIALGLSFMPFPNYIRTLIVTLIVLFVLVIFKIIFDFNNFIRNLRGYVKIFCVAVILMMIFGSYVIYPLIASFSKTLSVASSATSGFTYTGFYYGQFNTLIEVFRLFGFWYFTTSTVPYNTAYFTNPLIILSSFFWIILAVAIPFILSDKETLKLIIPLEAIILLTIFWEKAVNIPFGSIYLFITNHIPFGVQLLPTGFMALRLLPTLYSILAAYSIFSIYTLLTKRLRNYRAAQAYKLIAALLVLFFIVILLITALPVFNGKAEGEYFNESIKGYHIPQNYTVVRDYLIKNNGSSIVIPTMSSYVETSWGYEGAQQLYPAFFAPAKLYTLSSFGSYAAENSVDLEIATNLTKIIYPSSNAIRIPIAVGVPWYINISGDPTFSITYPLKHTNVSKFTYLQVVVNVSNSSKFTNAVKNNSLIVEIGSTNAPSQIYDLNTECWDCYIKTNNNTEYIDLLLNNPNNYNSLFNSSSITDIRFRFTNRTRIVNVSHPEIYGIYGFNVSPSWLELTKQYNISYVLVDNSILSGETESYGYINLISSYMKNSSNTKLIYSSKYISLYKITNASVGLVDNK